MKVKMGWCIFPCWQCGSYPVNRDKNPPPPKEETPIRKKSPPTKPPAPVPPIINKERSKSPNSRSSIKDVEIPETIPEDIPIDTVLPIHEEENKPNSVQATQKTIKKEEEPNSEQPTQKIIDEKSQENETQIINEESHKKQEEEEEAEVKIKQNKKGVSFVKDDKIIVIDDINKTDDEDDDHSLKKDSSFQDISIIPDDFPLPLPPGGGEEEKYERREGVRAERISIDENAQLIKHEKSKDDELVIKTAILKNEFLRNVLKDDDLQDIIDCMYKRHVETNEVIITQGEKGMHIFISNTGNYEIIISNKQEDTFNDQRVFGELAILYNAKRLATIKALSKGELWVLDHKDYLKIVTNHAIKEQEEYYSFLENVKTFQDAGEINLRRAANLLKKEFFKTDVEIVRQGDKGDKFYIIRAGTVTVSKEGEGKVATLTKGQYFGEKALLTEELRQATCTANSPGVECLSMDRNEFIEYLGDLNTWKNEIALKQQQKSDVLNSLNEEKSKNLVDPKYAHIELKDLTRIITLGVGGFGRVELVTYNKKEKAVFALKYLKKSEIVQQHQCEHIFNEKHIQMTCNNMFIVRLYKTFKDSRYLYLLMESCLGGDLWTLLKKQKTRCFNDNDARFLAAGVLEALTFLHAQDYVYRDLKPENLLIDIHGYIKLTDFGFAKKLPLGKKTYTFAGTPEYVAPEIVLHRGHDRAVDYWAFGILIFELLVGRTPFQSKDVTHMKTYNLILSGIDNVVFPNKVSRNAQVLIKKLCRPKATDRLGCQRNGANDIKNSKWFSGFEWEKFLARKIPSNFVPKLKSPTDTKYFETFPEDKDDPPQVNSSWDADF